jgi:hypothetical protein
VLAGAGADLMARPKKGKPRGPRTIGIRTTGEWADWIERAARFCRTDIAKLIDAAVAEYVKARGFDEPPPERIP